MKRPTSPDVLIVSYRRADLLQRCLESVERHLPDSTVYVWDNASDGSPDIRRLSTTRPEVRWTFHDENIGFAAAVNRLVRMSDSPTFFLLNPDAELVSDLTGCREALRSADVAAAAPWIADERHRPWDNAHREPTLLRQLVNYAGWEDRLGRLSVLSMAYARQPHEVNGYLTGAGLLISRAAWFFVGEFDERYFLYGEEADWCRRARSQGYTLASVPEKGIVHRAAGTVSDVAAATSRSATLLQENRVRYLTIHHGRASGRAFEISTAAIDRLQPSKRRVRRASAADFVITSPTLSFGGAERQRVALANGLAAAGEKVTLRLLQAEGDLREHVAPNVDVRVAPYHSVARDAGARTLLITGTTRIELAYGAAWRAANAPRARWVVANHHYAAPDSPVFRSGDSALMRLADGMIYLAEGHRRDHAVHQKLDRGRYWVVPNGIDPSGFEPESTEEERTAPTVVSIGRLADFKQVPLLVRALSRLEHLQWVFDIWGDGPDRDTIRAAIPASLTERIRLRGWCTDVAGVLAGADLFCTSSRFEAQPMTILEAMAAGLPVASSAVASVPEVLHGGAGVLVEPNTVDAWVAALEPLLRDDGARRRIGDAGRARVLDRYTEAVMIDKYRNVRDEVFAR
ncbi:hypothetical protein GCM10025883_27370 [Mobilicoccus caccae]|uniref:GT2 family glycosyltransferase n=1 Tax=Mobilicoccus caccae TaxID=1859295 RepID=A0ABQ6IS07_9MICO|nr:hypothetical protein GCM10025883_27370 [Mobilicoccus caccae]